MLSSRVARSPDMQRMGEALGRPGIDPRLWVSLAVVEKVVIDPDHGVLVDVLLLPSQLHETARVATLYAGSGFGLYLPLEVDDEVVVVAPSGEPDQGLVVMPRLWSQADPPPPDAATHSSDLLLVAKTGATVRVVTGGGGSIILDPRGSGEVLLGDGAASHPTCRGDALQASVNAIAAALRRHVHQSTAVGLPTGVAVEPVPPPTPIPPFPGVPLVAPDSTATDLSPNVKVK